MRQVDIIVTSTVVGKYEARSYPDDQINAAGEYPLYEVPVYKIEVAGKDGANRPVIHEFSAPRFMPYYNNPNRPDPHYKTAGWVNSGLSKYRKVVISRYKEDYEVRNRYSPGRGAIVVHAAFYIHAGPSSLTDYGFGSAGCIEIIGDYDVFKQAIARVAGLSMDPDKAIKQLVKAGKLVVTIQSASAPDIKKNFTRMVK